MKSKFGTWFDELKRLAGKRKLRCMVTHKEDHRDAFDNGLTPKQALEELIQDAIS